MEVKIEYNKEITRTIPYHLLPLYQLYYEQIGLSTNWDPQNKILQLTPYLQDKKIYVLQIEQNDILTSILEKTKTFFSGLNMKLIILHAHSPLPNDGEVMLLVKSKTTTNGSNQFKIIHYPTTPKKWAIGFFQECKKSGFSAQIQESKKQMSFPTLELRCQIPSNIEEAFEEKITLLFVSALLKGLAKGKLLHPKEYIETIFSTSQQKISPKTPQTNLDKPLKESQENPLPTLPLYRLEAIFDYQVIIPSEEDDQYLIIGNLYLKNSGNGILVNPHICLQVTPKEKVKLKGQIIPPNMVDTVGVQSNSFDSATGWRYKEDDWIQQAKEKGEYHIVPIQQMILPPGVTQIFQNFQISVPKCDSDETITVTASINCNDGKLKFPTNNRIILSLPN